MNTNELVKEKQQRVKKRTLARTLIGTCVTFLICFVTGMYIYANYPAWKVQRYLKNNDYTNAIVVYNDKIWGGENEETFKPIFLAYISSTVDAWMTGEMGYEEAASLLEVIEKIYNIEVSKEASKNKDFIILEGKNRERHQKAEQYYSSGDYINAMDVIESINLKYSQIKVTRELYDVCKSTVLAQVSNPTSAEEFEENIAFLEKALAVVNEPDFADAKKELEKEYTVFKDIRSIIDAAEALYEKGEYKEAFSSMEEGVKKYPDRQELLDINTVMHEMYIVSIAKQVKSASVEEDYKKALSIIETAIDEYDCEAFQILRESIKEEKSWVYRTYKNIKEKCNALISSWENKEFDVRQAGADAGAYILRSGEKIALGDYSDEDITVLSASGNILASIANLDLLFDVRDLAYDIQHIGKEEHFVARIATDVVALLPVIGVVKYLKYTDEVAAGVKTVSNAVDNVKDASKTIEQVAEVLTTAKVADNISEAIDNATDIAKKVDTTDTVVDAIKHYPHKTTTFEQFLGKEIAGVKYVSKKIDYSNGEFFEGVFPVFKSKFDFKLNAENLKSAATTHKAKANEALKEVLQNDKIFAKQFTKAQREQIMDGKLPEEFVWHHNEEEGLMQLVDRATHEQAKHTGGMSLWGKGYN